MRNPSFAVNDVIEQAKLLRLEFPQLSEDEELLADTLEGETDINRVIDKLVTLVREHDMMADALQERVSLIRDRLTKSTARMNFYRGLIHRLMTSTGLKSVAATEGKVSVVNAVDRVIITDETAIPDELMRVKKEPDKAAIKKALQEGKYISGATLSNGGTTIQIR